MVTGAKTPLDLQIKAALPTLDNVYDWIGETTLDEYIALSELSLAYVGGDTLNMHIAAAQNKRVFAIFGPTLLGVWSPWSNALQSNATQSQPQQTYGNITVFQADMPCVPCGKKGCDDQHGDSECLQRIDPGKIFAEVNSLVGTGAIVKISVIVTTYNRPRALEIVLQSLFQQQRVPDEILVADDGSGADTQALIAALQACSPCPLHHVWQADDGFRAAGIRNKAAAQASRRLFDFSGW